MKKNITIIVKKDTPSLGSIGNITKVRLGYALNYLIPNKIVEIATNNKIKHIEMFKSVHEQYLNRISQTTLSMQKQLGKIKKISVIKRVGDEFQIFGGITEKEILKYVWICSGKKIQKKQINVTDIKKLGLYKIKIRIIDDIYANIKVQVLPLGV